jgi:hypothetical protein
MTSTLLRETFVLGLGRAASLDALAESDHALFVPAEAAPPSPDPVDLRPDVDAAELDEPFLEEGVSPVQEDASGKGQEKRRRRARIRRGRGRTPSRGRWPASAGRSSCASPSRPDRRRMWPR